MAASAARYKPTLASGSSYHNESRSWHCRRRHVSLVILASAMVATVRRHAAHMPSRPTLASETSYATVMLELMALAALLVATAPRPSQGKLPLYLSFFQFVHNARRRGKATLDTPIAGLFA